MKFILSASGIILLLGLSFFQAGVSSCTKDHTIYDTITVNTTDTIVLKDTVLTADILTANPWKFQELRGVTGGDTLVYFRGGTLNANYDNEYTEFYNDGTGYSQDPDGYGHLIKEWQFANDEHTKLTFQYYVTNSSVYHFITWENIRYKNKAIWYDEYYHDNYINVNVHDQAVRVPK